MKQINLNGKTRLKIPTGRRPTSWAIYKHGCRFELRTTETGFVPFFEQKLQGLFKDFQGHISHFSRTPFSAKKRFESMSFLVLPQHEQFYPEGLSY